MRLRNAFLLLALCALPAAAQVSSRATSLRDQRLCNPVGAKTAGFGLTWDGTGNCWKSGAIAGAGGGTTEIASVKLTGQSATIAQTTLYAVCSTCGGMYRVSYYFVLTTAATSSSSIAFTFYSNDGTSNATYGIAAYTGNTATAHQSSSFVTYADNSTNIGYGVVYASSGGTAAVYNVYASVQKLTP